MAFLLGLVPIIAEAAVVGGEIAVAGGEIVAAGGEAIAAGGDVAATGGEIAATSGEVATATEAGTTTAVESGATVGQTGSTVAPTISRVPVFDMTASGTTAGAQAAHKAILEGAITFAKWAVTESVKQAIFYGGIKAAEACFHAIVDALKTPKSRAMSAKLTKINDAASRLNFTITDWLSWSKTHYDNRTSFGSVKVLGMDITRYEILQNNLGMLGDVLNAKVAPLLIAFNKSKTEVGLESLRIALFDYCVKVKSQSDSIKSNEQAMIAAGLQHHQTDLEIALLSLS